MPDDEIKVEQCDREAAAAYWKVSRIGTASTQRRYLSGEADNSFIVQAFARHRIAHGAQGEPDLATIAYMSGRKDMEAQLAEAQREIARLREVLERIDRLDGCGAPDAELKCAAIARAALEAKP